MQRHVRHNIYTYYHICTSQNITGTSGNYMLAHHSTLDTTQMTSTVTHVDCTHGTSLLTSWTHKGELANWHKDDEQMTDESSYQPPKPKTPKNQLNDPI